MLQPLVRRTWAEKGKTPILNHWHRYDRYTVLTALVLSPQRRRVRMFFQVLDHNAKAEDFAWFLEYLYKEVKRKLWVVWDNLRAHAKAERLLDEAGCRWLRCERLPAYAPELNPVEHVWTTAKWGRMANAPPDDTEQLWDNIHSTLETQAGESQLLKAHFRWAKLGLG